MPDLHQPPKLVLPGTPMMRFGHRHGQPIALPRFPQPASRADKGGEARHPHSLDIRIGIMAVASPEASGITLGPVVEESFTRQVMVDANKIGSTRFITEAVKF